jgi:transposase
VDVDNAVRLQLFALAYNLGNFLRRLVRGLLHTWERGGTMPKSHTPYSPEFRRRLVELVRSGRSPESLAEEYEPSAQTIRNWLRQTERGEGKRSDGLTTTEREELRRLKREVRTLREEWAILAKAAAWFARETGKIPSGSSSS